MIISRTPFRISFAGGCSDIKEYYQDQMGAVLSVTINKYVYLSMHPLFNRNGFHLKYAKNEDLESWQQIEHPIIREVFSKYDIKGVDFNSSADIPSGTGLGSSSSFTTGLINLCNAYKHRYVSKTQIATEACKIEIDVLGSPIGKQDQFATAVGGLNFIKFYPNETTIVEKINLSIEKKQLLEESLMLFYLGNSRSAAKMLKVQSCDKHTISKMVELAKDLRKELKNGSIEYFGQILHEGWKYKRSLSPLISSAEIDNIYNLALSNGATGGKLLGAGGTGFLLFFVPKERQEAVRKALFSLFELPFKFEDSGTTIIH